MSGETVYCDPFQGMDDNDQQGLIIYRLENGCVYNQLQEVNKPKKRSPAENLSRRERLLVTLCILLMEMGERLTYYSLVANIILFGKSKLDYKEDDASTINQVFSGFVFIIPIGGGFLADSYFGRFRTIISFGMFYIVGIVLVVVASVDFADWGGDNVNVDGKRALFLGGLAFIAVGTGGIKANVGPFGAEQLESLGKEAVQSFFNWFYWVINIGAFIAFAGVSYVQQEISFAWGYVIPLISMILSLIIFIVVKSKYIRTEPQGSILATAFLICSEGSCKESPEPNPALPEGSENKIFARAKVSFGGKHKDNLVDGVSSVIKVIPFCLLVIIYWTVYAQMSNTFYVQGTRMDVRLGDGVNVPVAALNIFDTIVIILLIPIVDKLVYPFFERIGRPLTYLKRIGIGMVLAAAGLFVAGVVEIERKRLMNEEGGTHIQVLAGKNYTASSMSIFVQIPQFALIGASEIFTSVSSLEFAYNQAPVAMQGLLTGLFLAASGLGSFLSTAVLSIVESTTKDDPWWGDEINDTKMENLLFLIGSMMLANLIVFCIVAHYYTYQDPSTFEEAVEVEEKKAVTNFNGNMNEEDSEKTKINQTNHKAYNDNVGYSEDP